MLSIIDYIIENKSTEKPYLSPIKISGAAYPKVPNGSFSINSFSPNILLKPKSIKVIYLKMLSL